MLKKILAIIFVLLFTIGISAKDLMLADLPIWYGRSGSSSGSKSERGFVNRSVWFSAAVRPEHLPISAFFVISKR